MCPHALFSQARSQIQNASLSHRYSNRTVIYFNMQSWYFASRQLRSCMVQNEFIFLFGFIAKFVLFFFNIAREILNTADNVAFQMIIDQPCNG